MREIRQSGSEGGGGCASPYPYTPPSPEVVHAIVTGTGPNLRALDSPAVARAVAA